MIRRILNRIEIAKWKRKGFNNNNISNFMYFLKEENKKKYNKNITKFSKKHGFFPSTVVALDINEENYKDYLSDYDYAKLYPLDGKYHMWIDNKITLKYLLGDLSEYMPNYYYQIEKKSGIFKILDCPEELENSIDGLFKLLKNKKELALKDIFGCQGKGFYKLSFNNNEIFIDDKKVQYTEFQNFIESLDEYIVTEYVKSTGVIKEIYSKTANSIRYIIGIDESKIYKISQFIKFGNKNSGYVDNLSNGGIVCPIDENGKFEFGYVKINGVMEKIYEHPDTKHKLIGIIEEWNQLEQIAMKIVKRLPQLIHFGFDFVVTDKGVKLLEINDMSGLLTTQKHTPLLKNKEDNFYLKQLKKNNIL